MPTDIIDIHAHLYPLGSFPEVLKGRSDFKMVDSARSLSLQYRGSHVMSVPPDQDNLQKRLASMDAADIDQAILSVGALNIGWARDVSGAARFVNDGLAAFCRQNPERFRFVAVLPCAQPDALRAELDRVLELGAAGVGISTNFGDLPLHATELHEFWREMNQRGLMLLVHPTTPCSAPENDPGIFLSVGYPNETAMAATKLALTGVLAQCPNVKIVWSHLGGALPMILDRIDRGSERFSSCPEPPSYYLRRCYFDTACCHAPALDCARATWGTGQLVFGSDVPHVPNSERDTIVALKATAWPTAELKQIFGATARSLIRS